MTSAKVLLQKVLRHPDEMPQLRPSALQQPRARTELFSTPGCNNSARMNRALVPAVSLLTAPWEGGAPIPAVSREVKGAR